MKVVLKRESYEVMGACFEVYKDKGLGFVESIYHECLELEFIVNFVYFVVDPFLDGRRRKTTA